MDLEELVVEENFCDDGNEKSYYHFFLFAIVVSFRRCFHFSTCTRFLVVQPLGPWLDQHEHHSLTDDPPSSNKDSFFYFA